MTHMDGQFRPYQALQMLGQGHQVVGETAASRTYRDFQANLTAASNPRTISVNGGARTGKHVVIVGSRRGGTGTQVAPTGVTLNGIALTAVVQTSNSRDYIGIWISTSNITTDGTDSVVATWASLTQIKTTATIYSVDGLISTTAVATNSDTVGPAGDVSLNTSANGVAFGASYSHNTGDVTWVGFTEDQDSIVAGSERISSASALTASASTPLTATLTFGTSEEVAVSASFR